MKRLTCEMCGSTDLIKQDGVFVCQTCGCKYSIEEAKKMMVEGTVEVTGTVKVDNSAAITNYLDMARNAMEAGNNKEADDYCNKIIEMDVTNWEAWFIKGKAVGWQSTLGNIRISETINAFSKALENCPEDKKEKLGKDCKFELEHLQIALLATRIGNFKTHPNENDVNGLRSDVNTILTTTVNFLVKSNIAIDALGNVNFATVINRGICDAWGNVFKDYQGDEGHPTDYEFTRFISEGNCLIDALKLALLLCGEDNTKKELADLRIQIYENLIHINTQIKDGQSYEVDFSGGWKHYNISRSLTAEAKKIRQQQNDDWRAAIAKIKAESEKAVKEAEEEKRRTIQQKTEAYWANHPEEKEQLESLEVQREALDRNYSKILDDIAVIREKLKTVPSFAQRNQKHTEAEELKARIGKLGFFQGKEKKRLQEQLSLVSSEMEALTKAIASEQAAIEAEIEPLNSQVGEIEKEKSSIVDKIASLKAAATKFATDEYNKEISGTASEPKGCVSPEGHIPEKDDVSAFLVNVGPIRMQVISVVKEITGLDLKRSVSIVDGAPKAVKENITRAEAEDIKRKLEEAGATVEIR